MEILLFTILFIIFLTIYFSSCKSVVQVLEKFLEPKLNMVVRIGRVKIVFLKLHDVHMTKMGLNIHIGEIGIRSSLFNSDLKNLLTLVLRDVTINKDIISDNSTNDDTPVDCVESVMNFTNAFTQFMAVRIYNISTNMIHSGALGKSLHATATKLHLDGKTVESERTAEVTMWDGFIKILQKNKIDEEECLGHFSFTVSIEATINLKGPLSVEKLHIYCSEIVATIKDRFFSLTRETWGNNNSELVDEDNFYNSILPIIPKNFRFKTEDVSLLEVLENSLTKPTFHLKMFTIGLNQSTNSVRALTQMDFEIGNLNIFNVFVLQSIRLDIKLAENVADFNLKLNKLFITYNKYKLPSFLRNEQSKFLKQTYDNKRMEINLLKKLLGKIVINGCAEFCQVSAVLKLFDEMSYVGFDRIKMTLEQDSTKRGSSYSAYIPNLILADRLWEFEVLVKSFYWGFKKRFREQINFGKIRCKDTPVFLDTTLLKFCKCGYTETNIELSINGIQIEWGPNLSSYIIFAFTSFQKYKVKLPQSSGGSITVSLKDFNLFMITGSAEDLLLHLDSVENLNESNLVCVKDLKLAVVKSNDFAESIQNYKAYILFTQVHYLHKTSDLIISLFHEVVVHYSINLHQKLLKLLQQAQELIGTIKEKTSIGGGDDVGFVTSLNLQFKGICALNFWVLENHSLTISLKDIKVQHKKKLSLLSQNPVIVSLGDLEIHKFEGLNIPCVEYEEVIEAMGFLNAQLEAVGSAIWNLFSE